MKKALAILVFSIFSWQMSAQINYTDYFTDEALRIDYNHKGKAGFEKIDFVCFKKDPFWGGSKKRLIDSFNYGKYILKVIDVPSGKTIYTYGYCTLFQEWQTTDLGKDSVASFEESVSMPFPKTDVKVQILSRDAMNNFDVIFDTVLMAGKIKVEENAFLGFDYKKIVDNGGSDTLIDIVIMPEGYTRQQKQKMKEDAEKLAGWLFKCEPFSQYKNRFNVWLIYSFSEEEGTDFPHKDEFVTTMFNSHFNTFETERYLTFPSYHRMRDIAANVPYEQFYLMVNTAEYGGGGFYNFFSITSMGHYYSDFVAVHEFGHAFAGLADEYSSDANMLYNFSLEVEPWQPNITTLADFDSKWKSMVKNSTPVPTPETKKYKDEVGVFEGAGYLEKGIYRPKYNCTMRSVSICNFCEVCQKAIIKMIWYGTK